MDRDIRTYFLFIGLPAVLITAAGLSALVFGTSGIAAGMKVPDEEKQYERYEQRVRGRMASRLKAYRKTGVADYVWKAGELPAGVDVEGRVKYGVFVSTNGSAIGWAKLEDGSAIGSDMPRFEPKDRTSLYLFAAGATMVALLFLVLSAGGILLARAAKRARDDLEIKNTFLDVVSHELNTPLGSIVPLSSALASGAIKDASRRAEAISTISRESQRMARMISELLSVVRLRNGKICFSRERVDLRGVAVNAASLARARHPDCAIVVNEGETVFAEADSDKTEQVAANLLENACRHAGDGIVEISCFRTDCAEACIEVADRGEGIPEEDLDRIFERFYQSDLANPDEGLGLGLNIVAGFVAGMGGTVAARAREGGGSVFSVKLPLFGEEGCKEA